ncbi:hypothetical protein [Campylobacter troglodytis]|uniref:hypothetical protein n=1 Tax=Campylobacter troglodytis TaxID=654363 RepID=UPI00115B7063|nr:hypothetical protein [Campylobacter troglodytis]TQR53286.1 hypothetical protein DMC01_11470 [Campylobacter troglodytis]
MIEGYLARLSKRELGLVFITILLLGGFLGFKLYEGLFYEGHLEAKKEKILRQNEEKIKELRLRQEFELDEFLSHFKARHKDYLDELYALATRADLSFESIKNSTKKEELLNIHSAIIELESDFEGLFAFLNLIQNSKLFFEFKELRLKAQTRTIKAFIHLRFVSFN